MITFQKQTAERLDHMIDLTAWLPANDFVSSTTVSVAPAGLTVFVTDNATSKPRIWASSGVDGEDYKITVLVNTNVGRVKEVDFMLQVRDI